jgi:hypothetical protein
MYSGLHLSSFGRYYFFCLNETNILTTRRGESYRKIPIKYRALASELSAPCRPVSG